MYFLTGSMMMAPQNFDELMISYLSHLKILYSYSFIQSERYLFIIFKTFNKINITYTFNSINKLYF